MKKFTCQLLKWINLKKLPLLTILVSPDYKRSETEGRLQLIYYKGDLIHYFRLLQKYPVLFLALEKADPDLVQEIRSHIPKLDIIQKLII